MKFKILFFCLFISLEIFGQHYTDFVQILIQAENLASTCTLILILWRQRIQGRKEIDLKKDEVIRKAKNVISQFKCGGKVGIGKEGEDAKSYKKF
ncbi:MAG: hypothetical protein R2771_07855 [Saprospiraceae bacterium]